MTPRLWISDVVKELRFEDKEKGLRLEDEDNDKDKDL